MNDDIVTEMPLDECWELLRAHAMGRLAFHLADQVHIRPINYVVDNDTLLFRTAEGDKLLGVRDERGRRLRDRRGERPRRVERHRAGGREAPR